MNKHLEHEKYPIANAINYMSYFTRDTTFMGFMPCDGYFGITLDETHMCAIHLFDQPVKILRSDDHKKEQRYLDKGWTTLLVLYGIDNSSYMKRFNTKESALKWIRKTYVAKRDDSWLFYNS